MLLRRLNTALTWSNVGIFVCLAILLISAMLIKLPFEEWPEPTQNLGSGFMLGVWILYVISWLLLSIIQFTIGQPLRGILCLLFGHIPIVYLFWIAGLQSKLDQIHRTKGLPSGAFGNKA
jgi:hypothetical protein